ncbi:zinc-binding dehydrogenase [Lyticum sinuosum]|uniref:Quinone oxidoreductase 1 n=1 Tax=Lyticum sinuosum TaxID=1332059 RepID=A0AAE4VL60_9RICK|nr:zinc-binding dehydrogenase [Lyticum sinuosum]MDZ5761513.1 Quinone oxidoreductase 1 [Lyticum sinuosum]
MHTTTFKITKSDKSLKVTKEKISLPLLEPGYALIRNIAVPIEDYDIENILYFGKNTIGHSALGIIENINGDSKSNFSIGEKVIYYVREPGSLAEHKNVQIRYLNRIPDNIEENHLAANYYKACYAHAVTTRTYVMNTKSDVIIHGASRASSILISQHCRLRKANKIIGICDNSVDFNNLRSASYDAIFYYNQDWVKNIIEEYQHLGATICYDNIGGDITARSIKACRFGAMIISSGLSSGQDPKISRQMLLNRSIYYTAPFIFDYKENDDERFMTAVHVFKNIYEKNLGIKYEIFSEKNCQEAIDIAQKYPHYTPLVLFK